ncbi:MAG: glycosyltransferase [Nanoarchaeota archaeon]
MTPQEFSLLLYNATLFPLIFFTVLFLLLTFLNLFLDRKTTAYKPMKSLPFVSVQVPTFNDPIAARCIEHCLAFDYPPDRYEVVIVDDSTNPETQALLKGYAERFPGRVTFVHRDHRDGFKPGALRDAMKVTRGEIISVFDADWIPQKEFLKHVVKPFVDPKVAIVQTRQGFYNHETNLITRFAAYVLMIYHTIVMPINNKLNCVFFCGTAGAIRRNAFEKVGGWNSGSITEDSELSVKLLIAGYRNVYLDLETPSEVPDTFEGYLKQQMRWCYGNVRVFMDNSSNILFGKGLTLMQRFMIFFLTLGTGIAPLVVFMTLFGFLGWFLGDPSLFQFSDLFTLLSRFLLTGGFIFMGIVALLKRGRIREFPHFFASAITIGVILAVANTIALTRAIFDKGLHWHVTPKIGNVDVLEK